jgi:hypothetical protein
MVRFIGVESISESLVFTVPEAGTSGLAFQTARRVGSLADIFVVPGAGIEPARPLSRKILSLVCLPISPSGRDENMD